MSNHLIKKIWFILIALALLVPRELNFHPWKFSFSITDVTFVLLILIWGVAAIKGRIDFKSHKKINLILLYSILLIISVAVLDWQLKGIGNKHVFFKDFYTFLIAPIIFIIVFNISKPNILNLVLLIFVSNAFLSLISIMIVEFEPLSSWYSEATGGFISSLAERMGYIITVDNTFTDVGTLRTNFLIGGAGNPGMLTILGLPIYLSFFKYIKKKAGFFLTTLSIIIMILSSLYLMSITIFISLMTVIVTWLLFSRVSFREKGIFSILVLISFLLFVAVGNGNYLVKRLEKVENFVKSKLTDTIIEIEASKGRGPTSTEVRGKLYSKAFEIIKANPLVGIGMGNHFKHHIVQGDFNHHYNLDRVENLYLTLLLKLGIIGYAFIFFFVFLLFKIYGYLRATINTHGSDNYFFIKGVFFGLIGLLVAGLFEYIFYSLSFNMLIWSNIAVCARILVNKHESHT